MVHGGLRLFISTLLVSVLGSGCALWDKAADKVKKGAEALGIIDRPLTDAEKADLKEAAKACEELYKQLQSEGYTAADIEKQKPEVRERIRLCQQILGPMWEFAADVFPIEYAAIIDVLSPAERSVLAAFREADLDGFDARLRTLKTLDADSVTRIDIAIQLLIELGSRIRIHETEAKQSRAEDVEFN